MIRNRYANCGSENNDLIDVEGIPINLVSLDLRNNINLENIKKISYCEKLTTLFLSGCSSLNHQDVRLIAKIYNNIPNPYKNIDDKFLVDLVTDDLKNFANKNYNDKAVSDLLLNNLYVTKLSLEGNTELRKYCFQ